MDDRGVSTGEIAVSVQSPADKVREVRRIRDALDDAQPREDLTVVFVGDGVNDILAMLEVDVGISLQDAKDKQASESLSTLHGVASRHGISIEPLSRLRSLQECVEMAAAANAADSRVIFSAKSWADIARVIPTADSVDFSQ
jgi:magnesium-transporting ATPase (P-type)